MQQSPPRRLVILPAYNEEANLAKTLDSIRRTLPDVDVLVVDDGSHDRTYAIALEHGVRAARHPVNLGYGAALQTGYRYAIERGYDRVLQMDADGQHGVEAAPALFDVLDRGAADLVLGSRFMKGSGSYPMPWMRRIGQAYLRAMVRWLTGRTFADPTTGYQAMNRRVLELYIGDLFPSDYPDADVLVMLHRRGIRIEQTPVSMRPREFGSSMHSGCRWIYYLFKMTLSLTVIAFGKRIQIKRDGLS